MNKILSFILTFLTVFILFWSQVSSNMSYDILPTTMTNVVNKTKLDLFLNKVLDSKTSFNSEVNYLIFLNNVNDKLVSLGSKYSSNPDIKNMIEYLNIWLSNIINITKQNSDVESFLCEIFWDCWSWTSSSISSLGWSSSCNWQYHAVIGPVWALDINPETTACTTSINWKSSYEISWNKQKVATCNCTWISSSSTNSTSSSTSPTSSPTSWTSSSSSSLWSTSCAWTAPTWAWIIKSTSVFWMVWSDTWSYVNNTKWTSSDLWQSCQWTCAPWYIRSWNTCTTRSSLFTWNETVSIWNIFPTYGTSACMEQNIYVVSGGLNKSSQPKGCAQPAWAWACTTASAFRDFTTTEWVSDNTVVTTFWANEAPEWTYEFFIMYWSEIKKTWSGQVKKCNISTYSWSCIVPGPVVVNTAWTLCNANNVGQNKIFDWYSCNCVSK